MADIRIVGTPMAAAIISVLIFVRPDNIEKADQNAFAIEMKSSPSNSNASIIVIIKIKNLFSILLYQNKFIV